MGRSGEPPLPSAAALRTSPTKASHQRRAAVQSLGHKPSLNVQPAETPKPFHETKAFCISLSCRLARTLAAALQPLWKTVAVVLFIRKDEQFSWCWVGVRRTAGREEIERGGLALHDCTPRTVRVRISLARHAVMRGPSFTG